MGKKKITVEHTWVSPQEPLFRWKTNRDDPSIYIVYSTLAVLNAHPNHGLLRYMIRGQNNQFKSPSKQLRKFYNGIIRREWVERAKFPIKFISNKALRKKPANWLASKNVVAIMQGSKTSQQNIEARHGQPMISMYTLPINTHHDPIDKETTKLYEAGFSNVRVLQLPALPDETLMLKIFKTHFIHETGHAIGGLKHYLRKDPHSDRPPFGKLTCKASAMGYKENCPSALRAERDILGPREIIMTNKLTQEELELMEKVGEGYVDKLGPVDLKALKGILKEWQERNNATKPQSVHQANAKPQTHAHGDLIVVSGIFGGRTNSSLQNCQLPQPSLLTALALPLHLALNQSNSKNTGGAGYQTLPKLTLDPTAYVICLALTVTVLFACYRAISKLLPSESDASKARIK